MRDSAASVSRLPTTQDRISLESASMPVQVHTSPAPCARCSLLAFFCLARQNDQISSHWTRCAATSRTAWSWWATQAAPASSKSLLTVFRDTSTTRLIDRMDDPSQSIERIWTRLARGSLFMPLIIKRLCYLASIFFIFDYRDRRSLPWHR